MDHPRLSRRGALSAVIIAAAVLLGACGSSKENMPPATGTVLSASTPTAGVNTCTGCHTQETADWLTTRHANLNPGGNLYSTGLPTIGQISGCTKNCHDPNGDSANVALDSSIGMTARPVVGCEACHGPGSLHVGQGGMGPISLLSDTTGTILGSGPTVTLSGQFVMCTSCHELLNSDGTGTTAAAHDTGGSDAVLSGIAGTQFSITDTHFATGLTYTTNGTSYNSPTAGYAMDFSSATVCTDCHNPHTTADTNRDWAQSRHGDRATTVAPPKQYNAWNHYNWSCDGTDALICGPTPTSVAPNISDRRYCQRCHTKTGYANYVDALRAGNTQLADDIHSGTPTAVTIPYAPDWKPEMLECRGCHVDNKGSLRNPGAYTAVNDYRVSPVGAVTGAPAQILASAEVQYPDLSSSNVCVPCHSGWATGRSLKNLNSTPTVTVDFGNLKPSNSHHYAAAATMFLYHGYEYGGRSYTNPASYKHDKIGTSAVSNTGSGGPCFGCHMFRNGMSASHLFNAVSTSSTGTILNIASEVCYNCHANSSSELAGIAETEREAYKDALTALSAHLTAKGLSSSTTNWLSSGDADWAGNTTGKNNLGAYLNYSSLNAEPGAFVHNSKYTKRLIYDSIDWLDDGQLNYSVGSTLSTECGAPPYAFAWCAGAMEYLLPNGVVPFAPSERPY